MKMNLNLRTIVAALSAVLIAGVIAIVATIFFSDHDVAQTPATSTPAAPRSPAPKPAPQQSQAQQQQTPAAPSVPVRTETTNYDDWTVTCREAVDGKSKRQCSATLPMVVQQQNQRAVVGAWIIARNNEGALVSVLQTPQIDVGVLLAKGVQFKLDDGKPRQLAFVDCNPQRCEATMPMDDATVREATADANGTAAITFWKADGGEFTLNLPSIKGIDKALAALR